MVVSGCKSHARLVSTHQPINATAGVVLFRSQGFRCDYFHFKGLDIVACAQTDWILKLSEATENIATLVREFIMNL